MLAAVGAFALVLGLLPLAPSAEAIPPGERDTDGQAETAQQTDGPVDFERLEGATRFQTAADIATSSYDASTDVVIATGEEFADALAGAGLEGDVDAPVLLTPSDLVNGSIPGEITDAIDSLGATNAIFLGGTNAISADVESFIESNSTVTTTERVAGTTRFETARDIAEQVSASPLPSGVTDELGLGAGSTAAFVATGLNWPDALAAGSAAFDGPLPILLTGPDELHDSAQDGLASADPDVVFVLGGTAVVGNSVVSDLEAEGYEVERLSGADRWETAVDVANTFVDDFGPADVGLATGFEFADALASAPYLGQFPATLALTPPTETHSVTEAFFNDLGCDLETIHVFGGQAAVQDSVAEAYADAACPDVTEDAITGTVTDAATDDPIEGADVTAENSNTFSTTTDADGEYTLDVDTPETYTVTADADGFQSETVEEVFVDEGEVVTQDFELSPIGDITNLSLTPQEDTNPTVGLDEDGLPDQDEPSEHTTTASLTDENGNAVGEGEQVRFEVYDRAFQDEEPFEGGIAQADADGEAVFTYEFETDTVPGNNVTERTTADGGDDIIVACVVPDTTTPCVEDDEIDFDPITGDVRNIVQGPNDTAEKAWVQRELDALVLDEQTSTVNLSEETHTVTGSIVDQFEDLNEDLDGDEVHMHVLDEDGNDLTVVDEDGNPDPSDVVEDGRFSITYEGPNIADDTERTTHRIIVCEDADVNNCLTDGELADDVLADEVSKDWVEITDETTVQLNWQNEFREDEEAWGGVDDFAADTLDNRGNGTIDVSFNSDLGVVSTHGWVNVTSEIPDDGSPAGANFHLHSGAIDAEGPVEVSLATPQLESGDPDERELLTYDLTGTIQDEDAAGELQAVEDALEADAFGGVDDGDVIDWYLNVHTSANPAGEVRGQLQAGSPATFDGGLSELPAIYESAEAGDLVDIDGETATAVALNFEADISTDTDETLEPNDFTVTVNGDEVGVIVDTPTPANARQIELTIDDELETDDNVTVVFEDSGREKVMTAETGRDDIGDGDLLRSWDTRSFEVGDPGPTFP